MQIPFVDLKIQYESIKEAIDTAMRVVVEDAAFVAGKYAQKFEEDFAKFLGIKNVIGCGNGTDSIEILLQAMGIGIGDEVIVPAYSWISTSEAVSAVGAVPVFVDIEDAFYCINPALIEAKITPKTKAIIPVHFYGQPADMPAIMQIAEKHNLKVLEDCAQAHGAEINGKKIGAWGNCASFSFYPGKNLGAYGDAGAMATNDDQIAEKARRIANHGQLGKHDHAIEGRNSRLDGIQGAILSVKLPHLPAWTAKRIENAHLYSQLLAGKVQTPQTRPESTHVFHLYVIRTQNRESIQKLLHENGVQTAIHYPKALPFLSCYESRGFKNTDFPVSFQFQQEILSLPMYAELTAEQIGYVTQFM